MSDVPIEEKDKRAIKELAVLMFERGQDFKKAISLLKEWERLNEEPCHYDHHGYCQTHYLQEDCVYKRTWDFLKEMEAYK